MCTHVEDMSTLAHVASGATCDTRLTAHTIEQAVRQESYNTCDVIMQNSLQDTNYTSQATPHKLA